MNTLRKQHSEFIESLPSYAKNSLEEYTGGLSYRLSRFLRSGEPISADDKLQLDNIDSIFAAIPPLEQSLTVFRGIIAQRHEQFQLNNRSFISTSYDKEPAHMFIGDSCCLLLITIPVGSKVICMESISQYNYEREILLDRGGSFIITGVKIGNKDERTAVFTTYIPKNSVMNLTSLSGALESVQHQVNDIETIINEISSDDYMTSESVTFLITSIASKKNIPITTSMIQLIEEKLATKFKI